MNGCWEKKKMHILMLSTPLKSVFSPPLHTKITDLKHDGMMNWKKERKKRETRQDLRLSVKIV
jgi:hypothetical protein